MKNILHLDEKLERRGSLVYRMAKSIEERETRGIAAAEDFIKNVVPEQFAYQIWAMTVRPKLKKKG